MDSNHRNPKMTDLQSVPFNHSGTYPFLNKCVKNKYYYSGSPRTCQHLFHFYFLRIQTRDVDEAVRADRAADGRVRCLGVLGRGLLRLWLRLRLDRLRLGVRNTDSLFRRVENPWR